MCPGKTELLALEVSPGVLLRVTADTGDKHFSEAAQALDPVGTAGHLVSIVVAYGIPNTPTALLANHTESALNVAVAQEGRRISSAHFLMLYSLSPETVCLSDFAPSINTDDISSYRVSTAP